MKITYDKEADAMLIYLKEDAKARSEKSVTKNCRVGLDDEGNAIFIELMDVSKNVTDLSKIDFLAVTRIWQHEEK